MVKRTLFMLLIVLSAIPFFCAFSQSSSQSGSFNELVIGSPAEDVGEHIAKRGGWQLIEFWHYSGGYWKATTRTGNGTKEIIIYDKEAKDGRWSRPSFLLEKIYQNEFVLEYKIYHPQEVLDALSAGATITPVMNIETETLKYSDEHTVPTNFFNFEPLPSDFSQALPEKPECEAFDSYLIIRTLPKLNCFGDVTLRDLLYFKESNYPYPIPIVQTGFGSLGYAMYYHDANRAGVAYSPDPIYGDRYTLS